MVVNITIVGSVKNSDIGKNSGYNPSGNYGIAVRVVIVLMVL